MSLHISRVRSSVKGGCDVTIGSKTLIVGPNASGKSRVAQSIQLATRGCVSELNGRVDVRESALLQTLFDRGAMDATCYAEATFSDGSVSRWAVPEGKREGRLTLPAFTVANGAPLWQPETVEPLALLRAATLGSDATLRAFFLGRVGVPATRDWIVSQLPTRLVKRYDALKSSIDPQSVLTEIDFLLRASKEAAENQRESTKSAKRIRETMAATGGGVQAVDAGEVTRLKKTIAELEEEQATGAAGVVVAEQFRTAKAAGSAAFDALQSARLKVEHLKDALDTARTRVEALNAVSQVKPEHRRAMQVMLDSQKAGKCLCCGGEKPAVARVDGAKAWIEESDAREVAQREARMAFNSYSESHEEAVRRYRVAEGKYATHIEAWTALRLAHPSFDPASLNKPVTSALQEVNAAILLPERLSNARAQLAALENGQRAFLNLASQRDAADAEVLASAEWKSLAEECRRLIGVLLQAALSQFNARVGALLPNSDRFEMVVSGEDLKHIEFGLRRSTAVNSTDSALHTALSGAERARVLGALASVIAIGPGAVLEAAPFHYVIPDDTGYDPGTLAAMLAAFENTPGQVIVATPTEPASISKAWTIVRTGGKG